MSPYHLLFRGLPQELLDTIFEFALYNPEGITVKQKSDPEDDVLGETIPVDNIKPDTKDLALGLFGTSHHISAAAQDIFYRKNVFTLAINPDEGFEWLRRINARQARPLQHVHLTRQAMDQFRAHVDVAPALAAQLCAAPAPLKTLTIDMPDDVVAGARWASADIDIDDLEDDIDADEGLAGVASPGFRAATRALRDGGVAALRLAFPRWYALDTASVSFGAVFVAVGAQLLDGACAAAVLRRHAVLMQRCADVALAGEPAAAQAARLRQVAVEKRRLFREGGFVVHRGVRRPGERGTVVEIQRVADAERSLRLRRMGRERSGVLRVRA
ncbi:hypothetical protein UCRNP2_9022 [Neofusicoccum parvum UCRNP2]|uniref:Uncharacterized protein n=1 Tax=Botryosphaeria parva (strain UCR-NP2) TaxID=1287680 RepID=R1EA11_BOTPV|nr:hypothetical protein UCRNP2_9022 [Neofusicoccum parvum UCRNP2]